MGRHTVVRAHPWPQLFFINFGDQIVNTYLDSRLRHNACTFWQHFFFINFRDHVNLPIWFWKNPPRKLIGDQNNVMNEIIGSPNLADAKAMIAY